MENQPYYTAYERRYKAAYDAGADRWGHSPEDEELRKTLRDWVDRNRLSGKSVIEFACGEGACGVILSELGCRYLGVDIAPSAVAKAREAVKGYPNARIELLDMVKETTGEQYDAALDCMGFHMLVTDADRAAYLRNAYNALRFGSPMLFYRESYRNGGEESVYKGVVHSYEEWKRITGDDYETPSLRSAHRGNGDVEVMVPFVPARANDECGYTRELRTAGFAVEKFVEMDASNAIVYSASVYARKTRRPECEGG